MYFFLLNQHFAGFSSSAIVFHINLHFTFILQIYNHRIRVSYMQHCKILCTQTKLVSIVNEAIVQQQDIYTEGVFG